MACTILLAGESAFNPGFVVNWKDTGVSSGDPLDISTCCFRYTNDAQAITVDIAATTVYVDRANRPGAKLGFPANGNLIRADNMPAVAPVHLLFEQPVSAAGAHVSALTQGNAGLGKWYHAVLTVRLLDDARRQMVSLPFSLSDRVAAAPFVGMRVDGGVAAVCELWFDVLADTHVTPAPVQVAIDELWFLE